MISLLCPTRHRSHNIERLYNSLVETSYDINNVELLIYTDDDDDSYYEVTEKTGINWLSGPRQLLSNCWNALIPYANGDIFMLIADDAIFRTTHWDNIVRNAFDLYKDKIVFVTPGDGHNFNIATAGFVHKNWIDTVGYLAAPYFPGDYIDTWLNDVARMIDRVHPVDVLVEHLHPNFGGAEWDETYAQKAARGREVNESHLYATLQGKREEDAEKLRAVMK